jgi:hypothetical protein
MTRRGLSEASRCSECRAEANWGSTKYSKTKTMSPTLKMMRTSRGIVNRFRLAASGIAVP